MTFRNATIGDIATVQTGPFGSQLHNKDYVQNGTPIVTVEHLGQRRMSRQGLPCVSEADRSRLAKYTLQYGDLVFSRVGSVDRCSWVSKEEDGWMFSGRCLRVRIHNESELYHKYLYYFFCLESTKIYIRNIAVGATMPSINTRLLSDVPVFFPNIEVQHQIGDILSALDDRIELNTKINNHLASLRSDTDSSPDISFGSRVFRKVARLRLSSAFCRMLSIIGTAISANEWTLSALGTCNSYRPMVSPDTRCLPLLPFMLRTA